MAALCRHCLKEFDPAKNHARACSFHPGLFVCRYHPNGAAASGDGLGYYGAGDENDGWPARFWDCCGGEDDCAPGCSFRAHATYDDGDDDAAGLYMLRRRADGSCGPPPTSRAPPPSS